ncbi:TWiK family of potassium channels protein 7 [Cephus cinctus]|uniref:TWiK family of potassium channels protein 7 n=1 Tax=Cephus cinctus TaxID=211228 RepID=A0AAJ7FID3_CEPCN|nr:TWiK family of potassium channels protein 7 [Cephus cinctus]XP_015593303.1 TWiK family of potassium channels protein 7 [Cephus cinctus]
MDVPLFPAPPTIDGAAFPLRDVPDVAASRRATPPLPFVAYKRHVLADGLPRSSSRCTRKRYFVRRNLVHPRPSREGARARRRVTELRFRMTRRQDHDGDDDVDVVCASGTSSVISGFDSGRPGELSISTRSIAVQASCGIPYRLRVIPVWKDFVEESSGPISDPKESSRIAKYLRFLGRLSLCQIGLTALLILWALGGAASFYATEGPREREQVVELKDMQRDLAIGLATELRQLRSQDREVEPIWSNKVQQYVAKHEELLLAAVNAGYGESGGQGQIWTFPGCILFAISLLTTLGFGAPVPRTTPGRIVTVVFAAIGIPAHFLLVLNIGILLAIRLRRYAVLRQRRRQTDKQHGNRNDIGDEAEEGLLLSKWVKLLPFVFIGAYYLLGIIGFGVGRARPFAACLLFPLDFTVAGGLATTSGPVRIIYAIYLEGAVTIAAVAVAILRVSATQSLTNVGLKYGLLTDA